MNSDVIVIGCGAAGLLAAISAGRRDKRVRVLEKNSKLGVKILMSGGTRCNVTHACDARQIIAAFGRQGKFLHSALAAFPPTAILDELDRQGVATKREATGKIFPVSDRALDVRDALVKLAREAGAQLEPGHAVTALEKTGGGFVARTDQGAFAARSIILTTGGQSYPGCGTTGDGYEWVRKWGHAIVPPRPALVPVTGNANWAQALRGVTIPRVAVKVQKMPSESSRQPEILDSCEDSFLFTHFGYSGPAVMNVSRTITAELGRFPLRLSCDWVPDVHRDRLAEELALEIRSRGSAGLTGWVQNHVPRRLAQSLVEVAGIRSEQNLAELSKAARNRILQCLKASELPVDGTLGFKKAEVTAGGVSLDEVDSRSMESKLVPGLFLAGEILDLDGPIGGFNFQSAFSTGFLAGQSVP